MTRRIGLADGREVTANVYAAAAPRGVRLVLAHGAGAGQRHPFMTRCAEALAARGIDVVTFDFPYMASGRRLPDPLPVLESCFDAVIAATADVGDRLAIGGKSMGGRVATHVATRDVAGLAGVLALGYPLHPPGRPDQLRVAHLPHVRVPLLVVQGSRDTFGTPSDIEPHLSAVGGGATLHVVEGGDHSLAVRRGGPAPPDDALDRIAGWLDRREAVQRS